MMNNVAKSFDILAISKKFWHSSN